MIHSNCLTTEQFMLKRKRAANQLGLDKWLRLKKMTSQVPLKNEERKHK